MKGLKVIFALLAMLIVLVAAWQNIPPILENSITLRLNLHWIQWETDPIPLYLIVPICFLAGFGLMWILDFSTRMRLRREVRKLEKELRGLRVQTGYGSPASLDSYGDEALEGDRESLAPEEAISR